MSHLPALFRLDPFRAQAVLAAPLLEHGPQSDDVEEGPLAHHAPDHRPVVVVEVAVHGDAAGFRKSYRLLDLAPLEVLLPKRRGARHVRAAGTATRASA